MCFKTTEHISATCPQRINYYLCKKIHHYNNPTRKDINSYVNKRKCNNRNQQEKLLEELQKNKIHVSISSQDMETYHLVEKQVHNNIASGKQPYRHHDIHLQTLKAKIGNQEIKILLDSGSTHTLIGSASINNLSYNVLGKAELSLETVTSSTYCPSEVITLDIPTKAGVINILGYTINKSLAEVPERDVNNYNKNLNVWFVLMLVPKNKIAT